MKKIILGAFIASVSMSSFAAGGHGPAGCGLGTAVIFKNADEWHEHVLAATTNASSGNQTFGMTSGTLGCQDAGGPLKDGVAMFIDSNADQLATDAARGDGETLAALSELIGVQDADKQTFKLAMKQNFDEIFSSTNATSGDIYLSLVDVMRNDQALSKYLA